MVVGVVGLAAGFERIIKHPAEHPEAVLTALTLGGIALFLIGRAALDHEVLGRIPLSHVVGVLAAAALVPAAPHLPNLVPSLVATLVVLGIAAVEFVRRQREGGLPAPHDLRMVAETGTCGARLDAGPDGGHAGTHAA